MPNQNPSTPDDTQLVAYLDNELESQERAEVERCLDVDPESISRLKFLSLGGGTPLLEAFESLARTAPTARLESFLDALRPSVRGGASTTRRRGIPRQLVAASFLLLGIAIGWAAPRLAGQFSPRAAVADTEDWRQAVAEYFTLYSTQTLALPTNSDRQNAELALAGERLDLKLAVEDLTVRGLDFRVAQAFDFQGKPLVQIAYLDPTYGPVALCIISESGPILPPTAEQRGVVRDVSWRTDTHGFMVVGRVPAPELLQLARLFEERLAR